MQELLNHPAVAAMRNTDRNAAIIKRDLFVHSEDNTGSVHCIYTSKEVWGGNSITLVYVSGYGTDTPWHAMHDIWTGDRLVDAYEVLAVASIATPRNRPSPTLTYLQELLEITMRATGRELKGYIRNDIPNQ